MTPFVAKHGSYTVIMCGRCCSRRAHTSRSTFVWKVLASLLMYVLVSSESSLFIALFMILNRTVPQVCAALPATHAPRPAGHVLPVQPAAFRHHRP